MLLVNVLKNAASQVFDPDEMMPPKKLGKTLLDQHVLFDILPDDLVTDADVLSREVLLVVERRELHGDPADVDRLEDRVRMQVAELAGVPLDVEQRRDLRGRRELPRDRPARVAADDAQAPLQLGVVDLHHDAVDLVGQLVEIGRAHV